MELCLRIDADVGDCHDADDFLAGVHDFCGRYACCETDGVIGKLDVRIAIGRKHFIEQFRGEFFREIGEVTHPKPKWAGVSWFDDHRVSAVAGTTYTISPSVNSRPPDGMCILYHTPAPCREKTEARLTTPRHSRSWGNNSPCS